MPPTAMATPLDLEPGRSWNCRCPLGAGGIPVPLRLRPDLGVHRGQAPVSPLSEWRTRAESPLGLGRGGVGAPGLHHCTLDHNKAESNTHPAATLRLCAPRTQTSNQPVSRLCLSVYTHCELGGWIQSPDSTPRMTACPTTILCKLCRPRSKVSCKGLMQSASLHRTSEEPRISFLKWG